MDWQKESIYSKGSTLFSDRKAAVLGNGSSRTSYSMETRTYQYVMGCNVPWSTVDATVVLDREIIKEWAKQPNLITVPTYFSRDAWMYTDTLKKRPIFQPSFRGLVLHQQLYTSGHVAVEILIGLGYNVIDLYGFDSWFVEDTTTFTRTIVTEKPPSELYPAAHVANWRKKWIEIIDNHPNITLNFIDHEQNIHPARLSKTYTDR